MLGGFWVKKPKNGCFPVWAAQEWGVTPIYRFKNVSELVGGVVRCGAAQGSGWPQKFEFSGVPHNGAGVSQGPFWPFLGCFEVWAVQEWGVTPI